MAKSVRVESGEVTDLLKVLGQAPMVVATQARGIVKRGAQNIKVDAQRRVGRLRHAPAYPRAISYDTQETASRAWAEIGPDKNKRQGALGNLIEYGSVNNPPHPHMGPAAAAEEPRFLRALEDAAAKVLGDR